MRRAIVLAPLIVFGLLLAALAWRLAAPSDTAVRSNLVGKPLPDIQLAPLSPEGTGLALRSITGKPMLINNCACSLYPLGKRDFPLICTSTPQCNGYAASCNFQHTKSGGGKLHVQAGWRSSSDDRPT